MQSANITGRRLTTQATTFGEIVPPMHPPSVLCQSLSADAIIVSGKKDK